MTSPGAFLTARWLNLAIFSFPAPHDVLEPLLLPGLQLDTRDGDDRAFVSLVAFEFADTRLRGMRIPGHVNFPEVNLRFYARAPAASGLPFGDRGVVFIRELVPRRLVSLTARLLYNEPYETARMSSRTEIDSDRISVEHHIHLRGRHHIRVSGSLPPIRQSDDSTAHWFKEHRWGFGRSRTNPARLLRYEIVHPTWDTYPVTDHRLSIDFAALYGPQWAFLNAAAPMSVLLAAGSEVAVYPCRTTS